MGASMICPNCGKELEEGKLLCENCGEEVKIVPVFDIELEDELRESISALLEDMASESQIDIGFEDKGNIKDALYQYFLKNPVVGNRLKQMMIAFLAVVLAGGLTFTGIHILNKQRNNSFSYQYENAVELAEQNEYSDAVSHLERALAIESDDLDARFLLAKYYDKNGQRQNATELLEEILDIGTDYSNRDEVYDMLLSIYEEQSDYIKMGDLLKDCNVSRILTKYNKYAAFKPKFNKQGGEYDELISISLSGNASGYVYYTLDGTTPTKNSPVYETPILLEAGKYVIKAKFINMYGVESDIETQTYQISQPIPISPVINLESGAYDEPQLIEVYHNKTTQIYYTIDGTVPDKYSTQYTEPIEMPYGNSEFAFIAIDTSSGIGSEVVKRTYQLEIQANFDTELAFQVLKDALCISGELLNVEGNVPGKFGLNRYRVQTLYREEETLFYIVYEEYVDTTAKVHDTGNIYAIDVETADLYKALKVSEGNYDLQPFILPME